MDFILIKSLCIIFCSQQLRAVHDAWHFEHDVRF